MTARPRFLPPLIATLCLACRSPGIAPLPPGTMAFGVFGDGPYVPFDFPRFRSVISDVNRADLQWLLHVGDMLGQRCSDKVFADRLAAMNSIRHPVIYTPGDNEWADCHRQRAGQYAPLERLDKIRMDFFAQPGRSLGQPAMSVTSQSRDPHWREFVENVRWQRGGFLFVTIHMVGSGNATDPFPGRTVRDDAAATRRMQAALEWLQQAFDSAGSQRLHGIVIALHADMGLERQPDTASVYRVFVDRLEALTRDFDGEVLLVHGDSHVQRLDHPLLDRRTGKPLANFTRLETFGSPAIGWVRVVVDTVAGRFVEYEARRMRGGIFR